MSKRNNRPRAKSEGTWSAPPEATGFDGDEMAFLGQVAHNDASQLEIKNKAYGGSWKKRGGVGAFMMLARKWDRLEKQLEGEGYDIFSAVAGDTRAEGLIDDIRDLRRYLLLTEAYLVATGVVKC